MFEKNDDLPQLKTGPNAGKPGIPGGDTGTNKGDETAKPTPTPTGAETQNTEVNLTGLWRGDLADGEVEIHITHGGQLVEGIKVSEGKYVPLGKVFFRGAYQGKSVFHGKGVKAGFGYSNPVWHPIQFTIIDANTLLVHGDAYGDLMFKRAGKQTVKATPFTAQPTTTGTGTTGGSADKKEEGGGYFFQRDPDAPLRPKHFSPRAEMLSFSPKVLITPEAYMRIQLYVEIGRLEVGWLGTATQLPNGNFLIDQTFLLEQEVTGTETELSVEGQNKLVEELLTPGTDAALDRVNRLRFWGHSHVRMGTGPSGTDESTMMRFATEGMPFYLRGIFNKLGRGEFTIYYYDRGYRICDAPWAVWDPASKKIILEGSEAGRYGYRGYQSSQYRPSWKRDEDRGTTVINRHPANQDAKGNEPWRSSQPWNSNSSSGPAFELPAQLIPSAELRREVEEEFAAKVTERSYTSFRWRDAFGFGDKNETENAGANAGEGQEQVTAGGDTQSEGWGGTPPVLDTGDGAPTGPGTQKSVPAGVPVRTPQGPNPDKKEGGTGLVDWFLGLFRDDSPKPPVRPVQVPPPAPKPGCNCPKCQQLRSFAPKGQQPLNGGTQPKADGQPNGADVPPASSADPKDGSKK